MSSRWVNVPFSPKAFPFFYGWIVLVGAVLAFIASIPGQTMGVGPFNDFLMEAWGLERTQLSFAYMVGTLINAFMLPLAGRACDHYGTRVMIVCSCVCLALGLIVTSLLDRVFAGAASSTVMGMTMMTVCFLALRFFGQGCCALCSRVALGKWFNHRRGLATAVAGIFTSLAFSLSPQVVNWLIDGQGWREAMWILAGIVGVVLSIVSGLIFRDNPEECGLLMDGVPPETFEGTQQAKVMETVKEFTRAEAIRTWAFWAVTLAPALHGLISTAYTFHAGDIGRPFGLTRDEVFAIFFPMSFVAIPVGFIGGWISDRTKIKYILMVFLVAETIGNFGLFSFGHEWGRWMIIVGWGVAGGLWGTLLTISFPRFFGRDHLGAISGVNMSMLVAGSAVGPILFSALRDLTGSYAAPALLGVIAPILLLLVSFRVINPQESLKSES